MIPESFQLGGRTWTVKRGVPSKKWYGRTTTGECLIELSTKNTSDESELHTFYHELMHAIASTMGWSRLNADEDKVDAIGGLLAQFAVSAKHPES